MIFQMAKKLGKTEKQIQEAYTLDELIERNMFEQYDDYIQRSLLEKK